MAPTGGQDGEATANPGRPSAVPNRWPDLAPLTRDAGDAGDTGVQGFLTAAAKFARSGRDEVYVIDAAGYTPETPELRVSAPGGGTWVPVPAEAIEQITPLQPGAGRDRGRWLAVMRLREDFQYLADVIAAVSSVATATTPAPRLRAPHTPAAAGLTALAVRICNDPTFQGFWQDVGPGDIRISYQINDPSKLTKAAFCIPELAGITILDATTPTVTFRATQDQRILLQLRPEPYQGQVYDKPVVSRPETGIGGVTRYRYSYPPADIIIEEGPAPPKLQAELRMARLRCEEQTEGGDDEVFFKVKGRYSDGTPIDLRVPSSGEWDIRDDREPREIRDVTLWVGLLGPGEFADFTTISLIESDFSDESNETPGAVRCIVRNNNGTIEVDGQAAAGFRTRREGCVMLDGRRVLRFHLENEDGHYVLDLIAPGAC